SDEREWAARLVSGQAVGAVARAGELVVDGPAADVVLVAGEDALYLHDRSAGRLPAEPAMDLTRTVGWAPVAGADQHAGSRIARRRIAGPALAAALCDRAATLHAAELLGASARMLEVATAYARTRQQFSRPIGSFQAVKHRLADMLVDVEGMRSAVYYAAWALTADQADAALAASTAKAWASEAAPRVLAGALQVHGGIGFTWDHDLHLYLKRVQLSATVFGDAAWHRERIAGLLAERLDAGQGLF
ncbi:MAG: acyl-CoA dehydrogenase family protein, partial [Mycobacteriales bacterium]